MKYDNLTSVLIAVVLLAVMAAGTSAWIGMRYLLGAANPQWPGWFPLR